MRRQCLFVITFLILLFNNLGWSQRTAQTARPATIRGIIRLPNNQPAPSGVLVSLEMVGGGTASQTQASGQGKFEFTQLTPAQYEVHISAAGYEPEVQLADVMGMPTAYLTFTLRPKVSSTNPETLPDNSNAKISAADLKAPADAHDNVENGRKLLSSGKNLKESIAYFRKAIGIYPEYPEAHFLMGLAYSAEKNWNDAEPVLRKAIELNTGNAPAYVALGSVENEKKNYLEAEKYLTKAVEMAPNSADAHFELGRAYWGLERWNAADQHVSKANELRPDNAGQHILMGNILLRERNAEGALKEFQQSLKLDPKGPMADVTRQLVARIEAALKQAKQGAK